MDNAHVNQGYRNGASTNGSKDILDNWSLVLDGKSPVERPPLVVSHPEQAESNLLGRKMHAASPCCSKSADPTAIIDSLFFLRDQTPLVSCVDQRNGQSIGISASYADHVALSPDFKLKFAVHLYPWIKMLHHHQDTGGAACELGTLRIVRHIELSSMLFQ